MRINVIDRIHELAKNEGAEVLDDDGCPIFEWELGTPVGNDNNIIDPYGNDTDIDSDDSDDDDDDGTNGDDLLIDDNGSDEGDIGDENIDNVNDGSISDPSDDERPNTPDPHESRSMVSDQESRSKGSESNESTDEDFRSDGVTDDDGSDDNDDTYSTNNINEVDPDNIIDGTRSRTINCQANIGSFAEKKCRE